MNRAHERRWWIRITHLCLASLLAACGGGGDDAARRDPESATTTGRERVQAYTPGGTVPSDAHIRGTWGAQKNWPLIPIHAVLLPDARVLTYGTDGDGKQTGYFTYDIWDSTEGLDGGHLTLPNQTATDIFCSAPVLLPSGDGVAIMGGDNWTGTGTTNTGNANSTLLSLTNNTLRRTNDMNRPRWYATATTLLNGETYIQGGTGGTARPEVRQINGTFRYLTGADTGAFNYNYPRNWVAPDGRIFGYDVVGRMYYIDPAGTGSMVRAGSFESIYGGGDSTAVMFRPGRILQFGGNSAGALLIDIRSGTPNVTVAANLSQQRRYVNSTVLPNGDVLATGGSRASNELTGVGYHAEIWDPDTGTWTSGAQAVRSRLYHSMALLMPDATVLVGGGGAPGPERNTNVEVYYPPYLFKSGGQLATRPVINSAPTAINIGQTFDIQVGGNVGRVVLIKTGVVTHSFNMEQRFMDLTYSVNGSRVTVNAPGRAADAPPGYYMLFVLDSTGVPSVAKILRMNIANGAVVAPTVTFPGDQTTGVNAGVSLQIQANDPNGNNLTYFASNLPPGLRINQTTGVISGTTTTAGTYYPTVTASDGTNTGSASFTWRVSGTAGLQVAIPGDSTPVVAGGTANFSATASNAGTNLRFKWNWGDGTAETAYSTSPNASHAYSQPGLYVVTVTAIDSRGVESRQTIVQAVYLPTTAQKPGVSSPIAWHPGTGGNPRLWVVNPDQDTVSVFDAANRNKLAETSVGAAPRTLAVAPNGEVWVVNRDAASISVMNPGNFSVARTITLPRASQPYGIAMSASGGYALVSLQGLGEVRKFSTSTYAQTGSVDVGPNPRHLSIAADGSAAYVARFITPPLPGEGSANVVTQSGGTRFGGEVVVVAPGAMSVQRTIVLAHSDKEDFENQGRGIPNYLGAPAISPDGRSAWVPSKQDNVLRGGLRDGNALNFQSTVRAISSRINLPTQTEDLAARVDHDNASLTSAVAYDPRGVYLFAALETSREVAVLDAHGRQELFRIDVGRAPQGLATSADGRTLFVSNFMDRSVTTIDLSALLARGDFDTPVLGTMNAVANERLTAQVLRGKQFFYDARDTRLARDRYMSCASCHQDGGHDGRTWDMTDRGEGLRNTPSLRGRSGGQGFVHWSGNFDEIQDFEGQIRTLAGGTGLMSNADFNAGTRSQPLGTTKAGLSADLDALAAYVESLNSFDPSPMRPSAATLSAAATEGRALFEARNCASCHSGMPFTNSGAGNLSNIGTVKASSGGRLGGALNGIDVPTLRDVWSTAPYLHDGSAPNLGAAIRAHQGTTINDADLSRLVAYLNEVGGDEGRAPGSPAGAANGLMGEYFANLGLTGAASMTRYEAIDFGWGSASPGGGLPTDGWSVRWTGYLTPTTSGNHRFQTESDDGVRVWVNGTQVINNWTDHGATVDTSAVVALTAGTAVPVRVEYYDRAGGATMRLRWQTPGGSTFPAIPLANLTPEAPTGGGGGGGGTGTGSGLTGQYYGNATLGGSVLLTRTEAIDFAFGAASPGGSVPVDNWSARWSGDLEAPTGGNYQFQTESDDGVRVWVNGTQVINNWTNHGPTVDTSGVVNLAAGAKVKIVVEYYDAAGGATIRLRWLTPGAGAFTAIPATRLYGDGGSGGGPVDPPPPTGDGTGLKGQYHTNVNLNDRVKLERTEAVNFNWLEKSPGPGVTPNYFSARWTGTVLIPTTGTYRFETVSDDGVRLWVNGTQLIDRWNDHFATVDTTGGVALTAGARVPIRLEYYDRVGPAQIVLRWYPPGATTPVAIPVQYLYPQ